MTRPPTTVSYAGITASSGSRPRRISSPVGLPGSNQVFIAGGDNDDLIQEGLVGLYKAIRDYRTDRESSFRNFAELCITRQIITAVKTATRNKHMPLNQYVSFATTPAGASEGEATLEEVRESSTDNVFRTRSASKLRLRSSCSSVSGKRGLT